MTLNTALNNALSGLSASSHRASVTSHNIANASTEGFVRNEVELSSVALAGQGNGVRVAGVSLGDVPELTQDRRRAEADLGKQDAVATATAQLTDLVGDSDDPGSLFALYEDVETSLRQLSDQPESQTARSQVVNSANRLTDGFQDIEAGVADIRQNADREISRQVEQVNNALVEIDKLNKQIAKGVAAGRDTTGMEQLRRDQIDIISPIVPVEVKMRDNGMIALMTNTGQMLVDATPATLEFTPASQITADMDYRGGSAGLSGLTLNGREITPSSSTTALNSGSLAGLFEVRDVETLEFQRQLDALADDLVSRFADPAADPTLGGNAGLFVDAGGAPTGLATGAPGAAGRLRVNAAVDPDQGGDLWRVQSGVGAATPLETGDNSQAVNLLNAMTALETPSVSSGLTRMGSATDFAAEFGSLRATREQSAAATQAMTSSRVMSLMNTEIMETGVDLDVELQELTTIENAYAANARVMSVIDEMLNRLMEI